MVLRHKPQTIGISLDKHGWVSVTDLLRGINATGRYGQLDKGLLEDIVRKDSKQRYSFSKDGKRIRANQGHSICVDVELDIKVPPVALYHMARAKNTSIPSKKMGFYHRTDCMYIYRVM